MLENRFTQVLFVILGALVCVYMVWLKNNYGAS